MNKEIEEAVGVLLCAGYIDAMEATINPNYMPYVLRLYFEAMAEAKRLFGF